MFLDGCRRQIHDRRDVLSRLAIANPFKDFALAVGEHPTRAGVGETHQFQVRHVGHHKDLTTVFGPCRIDLCLCDARPCGQTHGPLGTCRGVAEPDGIARRDIVRAVEFENPQRAQQLGARFEQAIVSAKRRVKGGHDSRAKFARPHPGCM